MARVRFMPECSCNDTAIAKKKGDKPPRTTQRTTGTETTQTEPETEQTPGRTATAKPTKREQDRAKAAAAERDTNTAQTTEPEKERKEGRTDQEQQPPDAACVTLAERSGCGELTRVGFSQLDFGEG